MRADGLLAEIESLTYRARCARLAALHTRMDPADLSHLIGELDGRGAYERSVGLFIAAAARDEASLAHIAAAIGDADAGIAASAIGAAVRLGAAGAPALKAFLGDAPAESRALLYRAVRRHRRTDLAEDLVAPVGERWGDREAAALLPACGAEVVERLLPGLAYAVPNWSTLGHVHPGPVLDHAERELADLPRQLRAAWWISRGPGLAEAVRHDPLRVIGLLEAYWDRPGLSSALVPKLGALVAAAPERMADLLLRPVTRPSLGRLLQARSVREGLVRLLPEPRLAELLRAVREDDATLVLVLRTFPPSRREPVFDTALEGVDLSARELAPAVLEVLPLARRAREARRMLGLRKVADDPERVLEVTAFLPYDQATETLREATRRSDAEERGHGYTLLIGCAGRSRDPEIFTDALESLARLRNEQDPVRLKALTALTAVPPGLLRAGHTPALGRFVEDALSARDLSYQTGRAISRLVALAFRQGASRDDPDLTAFALDAMGTLADRGSAVNTGRLDDCLRRGQEHELVRGLVPRLERDAAREEFRLTFVLATALRRRGEDVPELQAALERALHAKRDSVITQAIAHWLRPPRTRAERVEHVIQVDRSSMVLPAVFHVLATERTDLLQPVLSGDVPGGRFWRRSVTFVPHVRRPWPRRWTAAQRAAYLRLLHRAATDRSAPESERARAVRLIGDVPSSSAEDLRGYLRAKEPLVRRMALTAAPWTATPQLMLGDLLDRATGDDAHVAVYAAARAARFTPPSALPAVLEPVLAGGKITARKEAVRLLAHHRAPGAGDVLAQAWDQPGQHRDVRAALASAARRLLDLPVSERILTEAVDGSRDLARQVLGAEPLTVEPRHRTRYADLVVRAARSTDPVVRREALGGLPHWAPWSPDAIPALAAELRDLTRTFTWRTALDALVTCAITDDARIGLRDAVAALAATGEPADAEQERDLPVAQRLAAVVTALAQAALADRDHADPVLAAVDEVLPEPLGALLAAATLRWDRPGTLAALLDRPIGSAFAAAEVAGALARPLGDGGPFAGRPAPYAPFAPFAGAADPADVLSQATAVAERDDLAAGVAAVALAQACGPRTGWSEPWRGLLRGLRAHPHPDVSYLAHRVHTTTE
ncbi:hypothetical protein GCM10027176_50600 [Actinoallomurus bryophytorum]|uniref:Uncharacterized protein n=1 Tax=Actinoallomurus bryophytorum TaxID=1490222 RepID=A0A543CHX4_9ACTN|nr:hypothetical protein [Actinoallomurus bryophytorum]TQL96688.1 hypothetical protein FB559_2235 [Actinoallomurus bryophytorum]